MNEDGQPRQIKSVSNAIHILEYLRRNGCSNLSELEADMPLSAGTIHTYLATLKEHGFVRQNDGRYELGPGLVLFGDSYKVKSPLYQAAKDEIDKLARESGACVHLMTVHKGKILILDEVYGPDAIGKGFHTRQQGKLHEHIHCMAAGKAILAYLPENKVHELVDTQDLPRRTDNTIVDIEELLDELEQVRERGVAFNDQERTWGIRGIGAPILRDFGDVLGGLSITGPASNWKGDRFRKELPQLVTRTANAIEVEMHSNESDIENISNNSILSNGSP